jgi:hypothetical protein
MGCIARLGCLVLLAILGVAAWFTRDRWMSSVTGVAPVVSTAPVWEPITSQAADRGRHAVASISSSAGPVFVNLRAGEVASYVYEAVTHMAPTPADSVEAAVIGDALFVRAIVPVKEIAGTGVLGPLGGLLNDRERMSLGGTFHVVRPGLSEFEIREIKIRDFKVPAGAIPRLLDQVSHGKRPAGIAPDGLPVTTPTSLADVRIGNHRVTLYKTTAGANP